MSNTNIRNGAQSYEYHAARCESCAVCLHPSLDPLSAATWLGDFERCVSWSWCTRPVESEAAG